MPGRPGFAARRTLRPLSTAIRRTSVALPGPSTRTATCARGSPTRRDRRPRGRPPPARSVERRGRPASTPTGSAPPRRQSAAPRRATSPPPARSSRVPALYSVILGIICASRLNAWQRTAKHVTLAALEFQTTCRSIVARTSVSPFPLPSSIMAKPELLGSGLTLTAVDLHHRPAARSPNVTDAMFRISIIRLVLRLALKKPLPAHQDKQLINLGKCRSLYSSSFFRRPSVA